MIAKVTRAGDAADIAVFVQFPDLVPGQVIVQASFESGPSITFPLISDGAAGCYGVLEDEPARAGGNWTWHYDGVSIYHNVTLSVTTFKLGMHGMRLYAHDAGSGARISDVAATSYSIYGSTGAYGMFDTVMATDIEDPFVPGKIYNISFADSCRYDQYRGEVRSVLKCPHASSVWLIGTDGSETLLTANSLGEYIVVWTHDGRPTRSKSGAARRGQRRISARRRTLLARGRVHRHGAIAGALRKHRRDHLHRARARAPTRPPARTVNLPQYRSPAVALSAGRCLEGRDLCHGFQGRLPDVSAQLSCQAHEPFELLSPHHFMNPHVPPLPGGHKALRERPLFQRAST